VPTDARGFNPFPGLRPFGPDESHLFFGRENEIDELLRRLRFNRFLAVVGTSGTGKSSLVRSGLIPSLHGGAMASASNWRIAVMRPGEDPLGHLAEALDAPDVRSNTEHDASSVSRVMLDVTLRRSTLGLVEAVRQQRLTVTERLLVVVDQFEELFRFRGSQQADDSRDEAVAFVKLLLEATRQTELPIYVVLTMRSDFLGDCVEYPGLPEAVNVGQYLVPRMTRDEVRAAIVGPVAVAGGAIASRLVLRLLNDLGSDHDRLPVLQHALMRTWDHWKARAQPGTPVDLEDYEAIGTLSEALSRHAEEAFQETGSSARQLVTERLFKVLTDTFSDPRGIRRPCAVAELAAVAETSEQEVIEIVDVFRRPDRSFLMPPSSVPLGASVIVDLSHESLMRGWRRLIEWAEEERASAAIYVRLAREARFYEEGAAGLWGNPQLELAVRWRDERHPTEAWAHRYDPSFRRAMDFLDRSEQEFQREKAERVAARRRTLRQVQGTAVVLAALLVIAVWNGYVAERQSRLAALNLQYAQRAVDESLALVDQDTGKLGIDHPQIILFQRDLAAKAKSFYDEFINQQPDSEALRERLASGHFRLGQINRLLDAPDTAASEYGQAVAQFDTLVREFPDKPQYRRALGNAYNWLGETLRPIAARRSDAMNAYVQALALQEQLHNAEPSNVTYQLELARTRYNRGILHSARAADDPAAFDLAEQDFRAAIALLEALQPPQGDPMRLQDLGRAYNNLAALMSEDDRRMDDAQRGYERAVEIHEGLLVSAPPNREYSMELASFYKNLAELHRLQSKFGLAQQEIGRADALLTGLARPAPSLVVEQADTLNLRGLIMDSTRTGDPMTTYAQSLAQLEDVARMPGGVRLPRFHIRYGDLLVNLAALSRERPRTAGIRALLTRAVDFYASLAPAVASPVKAAEATNMLDTFARLKPELSAADKNVLTPKYDDLEGRLRTWTASRN
jgi:tetratricopeptide (TPR) repeat protein